MNIHTAVRPLPSVAFAANRNRSRANHVTHYQVIQMLANMPEMPEAENEEDADESEIQVAGVTYFVRKIDDTYYLVIIEEGDRKESFWIDNTAFIERYSINDFLQEGKPPIFKAFGAIKTVYDALQQQE